MYVNYHKFCFLLLTGELLSKIELCPYSFRYTLQSGVVIGGILFDATMATSTANKTNQPTVASSYYYGEKKKLLTFISSQQAFLNKE
jgi:hypothetical protein